MLMKELIEYIVKALVDHPDDVTVTQIDGEKAVIFELRCNEDDIGRVIGKNGRTIKAIRTLLGTAAAKANVRAMLEIVE